MATAEWTVLEKLLLSQAVYKYGEDNWFQIARNLKHHALLDRPSDYFNQKNCSLQYYLMVEDLTKEKRNALNQDMPVVVQIARQLYTTRLEELKKAIHDDEEKFLILVNEIDEIRAGKWDQRLLDQYRQQQHTMTPNGSLSNKLPESEATTSTEINAEKVKEMKEAETPSAAEITAATAVSPSVTRANEQNVADENTTEDEAELPVTSTTAEKVDKRGTIADGQQFQTDTSAKESKQEQNKAETAMTAPMEQDQLQTQSANTSEHLSAGVTEWSDSGRVLKRQADDHSMVVEPESKRLKRDSMSISIPIEGASSLPEQQHQQYYTPPSLHKSWQKNINLLWREIANHKNGAMFMNPIKESIAPRYYEIVKRPMELKTIKNRIRDGSISTTTEFERDVVLMLNNSLMYNKEGTEVYLLAREMLDDALEQIRVFKTADTESSASSHTRAAAMAAKADRRKSTIPE
ncbi:hypothetical protein BDF20DRAFT_813318 [Mycotypha africana]|uniref:uncharacterized protein n=1 Tax=Mycotypha africana TaxID=64632 RepID=UPI0022FFF096|nr:uncharacterized protein BDF20DRAFT_813318 [Mycotypha africana]KAI8987517.1 hypothetical protein BDF20DRAFT_813318 [Mycotypha africana]